MLSFRATLALSGLLFLANIASGQGVCRLDGTLSTKLVCVIPQVFGAFGFGSGPTAPLLANSQQAHFESAALEKEGARIGPPISQSSRPHVLIAIGVLLFSAGVLLPLLFGENTWFVSLRWTGLVALGSAAIGKKSLTYWILFAMVLGGEIGFDRPGLAEHLRILSDIFLRLIKAIVAPLILGSLVTGIAGHGDLRSLRRVALNTLVYFELVTTLALFIGVAVINISHAGEGLAMSGSAMPSTA